VGPYCFFEKEDSLCLPPFPVTEAAGQVGWTCVRPTVTRELTTVARWVGAAGDRTYGVGGHTLGRAHSAGAVSDDGALRVQRRMEHHVTRTHAGVL
jgi:hypothetical protein